MSNNLSLREKIVDCLDSSYLNLIILPTEKCNFRCTYCYEDFEKGRLKKETAIGIKKLIEKRISDLSELEISWFGGEPLLEKEIILEISNFALKKSKSVSSCIYRGDITTNAFLLNIELFKQLYEANIRFFQISLDGDEHLHNLTRRHANKSGTFNTIWENLLRMKETKLNFTVLLRVHFSAATVNDLDVLVRQIDESFGGDLRFKVKFKNIEKLGGVNDYMIKPLSDKEILNHKKKLESMVKHKENLYIEPDNEPYICYAARANSLVIRSDGSLAKCTVGLNDPINSIGYINDAGEISINTNYNIWLEGLISQDTSFLECPYHVLKKRKPSDVPLAL